VLSIAVVISVCYLPIFAVRKIFKISDDCAVTYIIVSGVVGVVAYYLLLALYHIGKFIYEDVKKKNKKI